jgi:hypothetical protein
MYRAMTFLFRHVTKPQRASALVYQRAPDRRSVDVLLRLPLRPKLPDSNAHEKDQLRNELDQ